MMLCFLPRLEAFEGSFSPPHLTRLTAIVARVSIIIGPVASARNCETRAKLSELSRLDLVIPDASFPIPHSCHISSPPLSKWELLRCQFVRLFRAFSSSSLWEERDPFQSFSHRFLVFFCSRRRRSLMFQRACEKRDTEMFGPLRDVPKKLFRELVIGRWIRKFTAFVNFRCAKHVNRRWFFKENFRFWAIFVVRCTDSSSFCLPVSPNSLIHLLLPSHFTPPFLMAHLQSTHGIADGTKW